MKIEILGTGCAKCKATERIVREVVDEVGIQAEIAKVEDFQDIVDRGVMITPAVVVNGDVKIVGKVPTVDEIRKLLN
jgi:small redox-active disulfide protein 2